MATYMWEWAAYFHYFIMLIVSVYECFKKPQELPWKASILITIVPPIRLYLLYKLIQGILEWHFDWTASFGFKLIIAILNEVITRVFKEEGHEWKLALGLCTCLAIFPMKAQSFDYMACISSIQVIVPQMIWPFVSSIFEGDI